MPVELETCANCGRPIGRLETPEVWRDSMVCAECRRRLSGNASIRPPATLVAMPAKQRNLLRRGLSITILTLGVALLLAIAYAMTRSQRPGTIGEAIRTSDKPATKSNGNDKVVSAAAPEKAVNITVRHNSVIGLNQFRATDSAGIVLDRIRSDAYILRNDAAETVTILKVTYNGDYVACMASLVTQFDQNKYVPLTKDFPISLTIGETVSIFHRSNLPYVGVNYGYEKDVLFIDVVTDRGTVRLKPNL